MIVEPDRDMPGSSEAHWATPIQNADARLTCSSVVDPCLVTTRFDGENNQAPDD